MATVNDVYKSRVKNDVFSQIQNQYNELMNQANKYQNQLNNASGGGKWTANGSGWMYTDKYGNTTSDVGNASNGWNGIGSKWDGSGWVGDTVLNDPNKGLNDIKYQMDNLLPVYIMMQQQQAAQQAAAEQQAALDRQYAAQQAATQKRIDGQVNQINQQRPEYQKQAESAAQQAYINKMMAQKQLGEQLASSGLSGTGVSESANITNENAYGQSINNTINARDDALKGLDNQITNVQAGGNATLSELDAAYQSNLMNLLNSQSQNQWTMGSQLAQMMANQNQQDFANKFNKEQFEYTKEQDKLQMQLAQQQAAAKAYATQKSASDDESTLTLSQAEKLIKESKANGVQPPKQALDTYKNFYGFDAKMYDDDNVKAALAMLGSSQEGTTATGNGYNSLSTIAQGSQAVLNQLRSLIKANKISQFDADEIARRLNLYN